MTDSNPTNRSKSGRQLDLGLATIIDTTQPEPLAQTQPGHQTVGGLSEDVLRAIKSVKLSPALGGPAIETNESHVESAELCLDIPRTHSVAPAKPQDLPSKVVEVSDYDNLARKSDWKALGLLCEGRMSSNPTDVEARLWWVKSQLVGSGVPVSMLTAPLDSASKDLLDKTGAASAMDSAKYASMSALSGTLLAEMGELSLNKGDDLVAITLLERANLFGVDVKALLRKAISQARARIETGRKSAKDEEILARLLKIETSLGPVKFETKKSRTGNLESRPLSAIGPTDPKASSRLPSPQRRSRPRWWLAVAVLVGIVFGGYFLFPELFGLLVKPSIAPVALLEDAPNQAPILPAVSSASQPGNLDAILYEMDSQGQKVDKTNKQSNPEKQVVGDSANQQSQVTSGSTTETVSNVTNDSNKGPRETINTSGPIEPPSTRDDGVQKRRPVDQNDRPRRQKGDRGEPVVEEFSPGRLYRVIVPTRAMAGPTLRGQSLVELDVEDRIMVEARLGIWLKIRSKKGQIAYILAQDAQEAGDSGPP